MEIGDKVLLREGLIDWHRYGTMGFFPPMRFAGTKQIVDVNGNIYVLGNGFAYNDKMIQPEDADGSDIGTDNIFYNDSDTNRTLGKQRNERKGADSEVQKIRVNNVYLAMKKETSPSKVHKSLDKETSLSAIVTKILKLFNRRKQSEY